MLAVCLYKRNGGAVDDEKAKKLIRKLEGEDGPGAAAAGGGGVHQRWKNNASVVARLRTAALVEMYDPPYIDNWVNIAKPERVFAHNAGGNCSHLPYTEPWDQPTEFCSEDCRIRFVCETFFNKYFL
ncbi:unnamed protein product [Urochloa humidicola]